MTVIDVHTHAASRSSLDRWAGNGTFGLQIDDEGMVTIPGLGQLNPVMYDHEPRFEQMASMGVDMALFYPAGVVMDRYGRKWAAVPCLVVLSIGDRELTEAYATLKNEMLQHPNVLHASAIHSIPGYQRSGYGMRAEGVNMEEGESILVGGIPSDPDVVETLGLDLLAGAGFPKSEGYTPEPGKYVYLVNETLLSELGWSVDEAVGRRINLLGNRLGEIVGVFKDYHFLSLHQRIEPMAFFIEPRQFAYLMVKIAPTDVPGTLAAMEATWQRLAPHRPFVYRFLDQEFNALYRADQQTGQILSAFAVLAVLIACLGLFGLASFAAEQRTKEIGVRKVLGASASQIVLLLTKDFTRLVVVAFVVAAPMAYLVMNRWLESFAYRVDMMQSWWIFLLAGLATLVVAFLTVSYQSIRAALANPALSLRYE